MHVLLNDAEHRGRVRAASPLVPLWMPARGLQPVATATQPAAYQAGPVVVVHDESVADAAHAAPSSLPVAEDFVSVDLPRCAGNITHPILPAASAPRRMVSDEATTYLLMLDRSECPSASAAAFRSPVAARNRVAYLALSLWAV